MTAEHIKRIIQNGEGIDIEFKESRTGLPRSLFETACAFLNTKGGAILLGVDDAGKITGIKKEKADKLKKVFPFVSIPDFNNELIVRAKNLIRLNSSEHHWAEPDNKTFLTRTGLYRKDNENNQGYTLAAILFFGWIELFKFLK